MIFPFQIRYIKLQIDINKDKDRYIISFCFLFYKIAFYYLAISLFVYSIKPIFCLWFERNFNMIIFIYITIKYIKN